MLHRIFILIAAIGVILVGLIFIVPFVLPADTVKTQIEKLITENTGWKIRFGGDVSMSLVPSVRLVAQDIEISPPNHKPILKAQEARFAVGLRALFSGAVDIEEIYFGQPDLTIELAKNGNPVWLPEDASAPVANEPTSTVNETESDTPGTAGGVVRTLVDTLRVERLAIDQANISFGTIGETPSKIQNIVFTASLPNPQGALNVNGSAVLNGEKITLTGTLPAFKNLINTNKGSMSVDLGYKTAKLSTSGPFDLDADIIFDGAVDLNIIDISQITGDALASGVVKATGTLAAGKEQIQLELGQGQFLDTTFATKIQTIIGGARPFVTGSIDLGALNLDTLQPAQSSTPSPSKGASQGGQNTEPDLSGLGGLDADISFSAASIKSGEHKIDNLKGGLILNDGVGELKINEVVAVGGSASARLTADTKVSPLTTYGTLKANNLSISTILALAGQDALVKQLKGLIGTNLVFGFQGLTPNSILNTVNARGTLGISKASMSGLGLASTFNNDPSADRIEDVSLQATIDGFTKPVSVDGQARFRGEVISLGATSDPAALIAGQKAKTSATVSFSKASASFNGDISSSIPAAGTIALKGKSLRALAKWFGTELPSGPGYGRFDIKTGFAASEKKVSLNDLSVVLDDIKGQGSASVLLNDKPDITANISFDLLDVNPYIATPAEGGGGAASGASNSSSAWSSEPIDFSFTNSANLNLTARVNTLKAQGMSVGPLALQTTMRGGKLTADLSEMTFYGGKANAKIVVDAANQTPAITAQLTSNGVQAYPFLRDAAKFERIEGGLDYILNVTTAGNSQADMVAALNGKTSFNFNNGAIRGINIAKAMRSLTGGALNGWNNSASEKTDFSAFTASFDITNGVATNTDLNLVGPLVRVSGEGTIQMPPQTLKYRVDPKIVASLEGQGGSKDLAGFGVPIIIEGPWAKPKIYPDIKGFLQDPAAGLAALKSLGGGFDKIASGNTGEILSALGDDPKGAAIAKAADKIKKEIGVDVSGLLKDGKISKEGGAAAVVGALGGLLGGGSTSSEPIDAAPLQVGQIPVPRAKPRTSSVASSPVADIVKQAVNPNSNGQNGEPNLPVAVPQEAEQLIKGIGGLFGR
ncbi:MAG: AsmA family protein [Hyphomicrobiales bacterium]